MKTTRAAHALKIGTEKLVFKPSASHVVIDHHFPNGIKGRPGVGIFGRQVSKPQARKLWLRALAAGWQRA